jgi:protein gp37
MTGINYLDEAWNPITGCSGMGCKANCWAREMVRRFPAIHQEIVIRHDWDQCTPIEENRPFSQAVFHPDRLDKPLYWKKPRRVGVAFMGDWMDNQVKCEWIDQILEVIAACPQHQFLSLTKQPQNLQQKIYAHCPESPARELGGGDYLPNLWHGVSVTDQEDADRMIPELLKVPGKRWVSVEPMLGPIDLTQTLDFWDGDTIPAVVGIGKLVCWIIIGCESGPKRRPCPQGWMIDVVRHAQAAGVPVYCKQIQDEKGKVIHDISLFPKELQVRESPNAI